MHFEETSQFEKKTHAGYPQTKEIKEIQGKEKWSKKVRGMELKFENSG